MSNLESQPRDANEGVALKFLTQTRLIFGFSSGAVSERPQNNNARPSARCDLINIPLLGVDGEWGGWGERRSPVLIRRRNLRRTHIRERRAPRRHCRRRRRPEMRPSTALRPHRRPYILMPSSRDEGIRSGKSEPGLFWARAHEINACLCFEGRVLIYTRFILISHYLIWSSRTRRGVGESMLTETETFSVSTPQQD